jgi:cell division inhibitor SepF
MHEYSQEDDEEIGSGGIRSRLRGWVEQWRGQRDEFEEEDEPAERINNYIAPSPGRNAFRVASVRDSAITVMPASSFADIQRAADRLKKGEPQIVNLEKTPPDMAERLIDFLNGVTYALDGCVEKVAEGAYLFTPAHVAIHADGGVPAPATAHRPFFDRS